MKKDNVFSKLPVKETSIRKAVRDYLRLRGWFVWTNVQSALSYKGVSDLTAIKNGIVLWIEIKTPTGRQSKHQIKFQKDVSEHGGHYLLIRDVEEIIKIEGLL